MNFPGIAALFAATALPLGHASGMAIIQQGVGEGHVAFQVESAIDSTGVDDDNATTWAVIADDTANGAVGGAIQAVGSSQTSGVGEDGTGTDAFISWRIVFNDQPNGDSDLWNVAIRHRVESGNSAWLADGFNVDPTGNNFSQFDNSNSNADYEYLGIIGAFDISDNDLGKELVLTLKVREAGYIIDRIVLTQTDSLINNASALDALNDSPVVIPEPGAMTLAGMAVLFMMNCRRR